jgi:hypothetical protein
MRTLEWSIVVRDYEYQTPEILAEAERTGQSVDDVVCDRVRQVMHDAGQAYIAAHPAEFRHGTELV